jgi:glutamine synthetase
MAKMGVKVEKHHHEVASAQHELGMKLDTLTLMADQMQIYKYCIHQVAHIYGSVIRRSSSAAPVGGLRCANPPYGDGANCRA